MQIYYAFHRLFLLLVDFLNFIGIRSILADGWILGATAIDICAMIKFFRRRAVRCSPRSCLAVGCRYHPSRNHTLAPIAATILLSGTAKDSAKSGKQLQKKMTAKTDSHLFSNQ